MTGHTDALGDEATNLALSRARAQAAVDYMVANGLPPERVVARGVGEAEPVATNDTPEGQQANRRIEASVEGITPG
jgi:outer membrane protein OmpA-like peptidoglycan-associated protein